jgi:hypothetical protein
MFRALLDCYPCIPAGHHRLSRTASGPKAEENQRLLEEAVASQRAENSRHLAAFLTDPQRCKGTEKGGRMRVNRAEADWLLQVINDIRVGSWIRLGSPDFEAGEKVRLDDNTAPHYWAMEAAARFEWILLDLFPPG